MFTSHMRKLMKRAEKLVASMQPSPQLCRGGTNHPDCRMPIYFLEEQGKVRDTIIYAYQVSRICPKGCVVRVIDFPDKIITRICPHCGGPLEDDEVDHQIYGEIFDLCFCCVMEHPSIQKEVGSKAVKAARVLRKMMSVKYAT